MARIVSACFILLLKGNGAGLDSVYHWLSKYVSNDVNLRQHIDITILKDRYLSVCVVDGRFKHRLFCVSALVLLVKGPSVLLTQSGLSLCPLFTVTVIGPMEAKTKGGLFLLSCPGLSAPLWAQTEPRGWGLSEKHRGGFDLTKNYSKRTSVRQ